MPDKRYVKGCGKSCIRCWVNRQNHGNKLKKKLFPKKFEDEKEDEEKVYISVLEEFLDKFVISNYTMERIEEIDNLELDPVEHNCNLIKKTTKAYNDWALKEKGINKKIKEKDWIKTMNSQYKNSEILEFDSLSTHPITGVPNSQRFYMFECIY